MRKVLAATVVCIGVLGLALWALALDFQPGNYKVTSTVEMVGMPMQMPPQTVVECLTKQDPLPESTEEGGCRITDRNLSGNTDTWSMQCDQQGQTATGHGKMVYSGDSFNGTFTIVFDVQGGGSGMTMTTTTQGERLGDCQ